MKRALRILRGAGLLVLLLGPCGRLSAISDAWVEAHRAPLQKLFAALDPEHPAVAESVRAWSRGDPVTAGEQLVRAFRERAEPLPGLAPTLVLPDAPEERADALLEGILIQGGRPHVLAHRADGGIDWRQRGPRDDKEFAWMLNRHLFVGDLLRAHRATGAPAYAAAADALLADWVMANPYPDRLTFSEPWRALEVARRLLDTWGPFFDEMREPGVLSDESLLLLLSSIPDHADALLEHASVWGGNHLVTEKIALLLAGLLWPEFREAAVWKAEGLRAATREVLSQSYPDGAYMELSNHYQRVVLNNVQHLAELLALAGEPPSGALGDRLEAMWDYFAGVMKPDGSGPLNNAGDRENNALTLLPAAERWERDDWLFLATRGERGEAPVAEPSRLFLWAGHAVLRDGWAADSNWAFFDFGPSGTAHQHDDALHTSIVLDGRDFLIDSGRYTYFPGPWKNYFTGPHAHNVLTFEGLERRPRPARSAAPWGGFLMQRPEATAVAGEQWFDPPAGAPEAGGAWRQRRLLLHLRGGGYVLVDRVTGFGPARARFHWQFAPDLEQSDIEERFTLHTASSEPATTWLRGSEAPIAGWYSPQYGTREAAWQREDAARLSGPHTFVWLVGAEPEVSVEMRGAVVEVDAPQGRYRLDLDALTAEPIPVDPER